MIIVNGELTLALFTVIGVIIGYLVTHFLTLREKSIIREFEMRKEGRDFYLLLYGHLANLADLVSGYLKAVKGGEVKVIVEGTYKSLDSNNVVSQFKQAFEKFVQFCDKMRTAGYELFVPDDICQPLHEILRNSMLFTEQKTWDLESARLFIAKADSITDRIEEVMGIRRRPWKKRLLKTRVVTFLRECCSLEEKEEIKREK